ncbi:type II toxin-antitoxin system HicB family antitoxin [Nostoc sp.]|uniref:type II toxin-antitoxin system HicB family antitoxin n=1 Tax=Nostoc sp. TaxID=1180 RepID=UPI002FF9855E
MKIKAVIWQEDGVWCGSVPALPGCHTWGDSYENLLEMLQDAIQGWLEVASQREDQLDLASFSLEYAASIFPESEETV